MSGPRLSRGDVVFPAHAGMNRLRDDGGALDFSVPRTRGDEPTTLLAALRERGCSPHTRG